jgi:hypothetical protein
MQGDGTLHETSLVGLIYQPSESPIPPTFDKVGFHGGLV